MTRTRTSEVAAASTLTDLVAAVAAGAADKPALVDGETGAAVSYGRMATRIDRVAGGLAGLGVRPGGVVALWAPNSPAWLEVALGTMAAGAVATGIAPQATEPELRTHLADTGARVVVTVPRLAEVARRAPGVERVVVLGEAGEAPSLSLEGLIAGAASRPPVDIRPGDVAYLASSSGTTGLPKPVPLTHGNFVAALRSMRACMRPQADDRALALAPLTHVMGLVVTVLMPMSAGATIVTVPRFDLERMLEVVAEHAITMLVLPPPVMVALARHPAVDRHDLSSLRLVVCGGAPLAAEVQGAVGERLPGAVVGQGYGMTETTAIGALPDRDEGSPPGSVGRSPEGAEIRVVDPATGDEQSPGEVGELWLRGPHVMSGYLDRPEATAELLDADGWLRSGDLGRVTAAGDVYVVGRLKELIKVSAHPVAPAELEAVLAAHPAVADVAVIQRPHDLHGEVPVAVVVAREEVDGDELLRWVAERVSPHKRIRAVRFAASIPRTPAGKILRRVLIEEDRQPA
jgi:acyl-CoA synthetase (AMP-forming)/AMP-acid ligase II